MITNVDNPRNTVEVAIRAMLTQSIWRFEGLHDGRVILPGICVPYSSSSLPGDASLSIHCLSTGIPVSCSMKLSVDASVAAFLNVSLLSFSSTAPIERFKFTSSTASVVLRVRGTATEGGRIPLQAHAKLGLPSPPFLLGAKPQGALTYDSVCHEMEASRQSVSPLVQVGTIVLEAEEQPNKEIPVLSTLVPNDTFSLSCRQLSLTKVRESCGPRVQAVVKTFRQLKAEVLFLNAPQPNNCGAMHRVAITW